MIEIDQIRYVRKNLRAFEATAHHRTPLSGSSGKANLGRFVQFYLRRDGLFILRMISLNIGEMVAAEVLLGLWQMYGPDRRMISDMSGGAATHGQGGGNGEKGAGGGGGGGLNSQPPVVPGYQKNHIADRPYVPHDVV